MRTALRTSIVTAALAGALLAPAATAIAAPAQAAQAVTAVSAVSAVSADASGNDRYDGQIVQLGKGKIAVLRNKSEGPEVWIRAGADTSQGAAHWAGRVLAKLDLTHPLAVIDGVQYKLTNKGEGFDIRVLGEGASTFRLMPKAEPAAKPSTKPSAKPATKPSAKPATDAKPQTVVVPKGPVAAGAELAPQDDVNTAAIGAGLVAMFAALATALTLRARKARTRA